VNIQLLSLCLMILLTLFEPVYAQPKDISSAKSKELSILTDDGKRFQVKIEIVKPPKNFIYKEGWRWGSEQATPKYIIRRIKAWWGSDEIFIPLSAYIDLSNPNDVFLKKQGNELHLIVKGGDAGSSYEALLIFVKAIIRSRKVIHGEFPDEAWEETKYSFNELDN